MPRVYGIAFIICSYVHFFVELLLKRFFCTQFSIWPVDGTLTGAITPDLSGPVSNGSEVVFHIWLISRTGASLSDAV